MAEFEDYNSIWEGEEIDDAIAKIRNTGGSGTGALTAANVGAAPAGYGLGGQSKFISSSDDLNNVVYDGWYYFDASPINAPLLDGINTIGYASMLVSNRIPSLYVTQEIFCYTSWEAFNCVLRRCRINGEWKPWEWVDPPMMVGVEYRTTERYNGKPVYKKMVNCGKFPSSGSTSVYYLGGSPDDRSIYDCFIEDAYLTYYGIRIPEIRSIDGCAQNFVECNGIGWIIMRSITGADDRSLGDLIVTAKYTKV